MGVDWGFIVTIGSVFITLIYSTIKNVSLNF
jgi:hypothetical protein